MSDEHVEQVAKVDAGEGPLPIEGVRCTDRDGRVLMVREVALGDPLGREVRGLVWGPQVVSPPAPTEFQGESHEYATSLDLWRIIWTPDEHADG